MVPKLRNSRDRKVSPRSRRKPSGEWTPLVANSLGLISGKTAGSAKRKRYGSCPFATEFCVACYAKRSENMYSSVERLVSANFELLRSCRSNVKKMVALLTEIMDEFVAETMRVGKRLNETLPLVYRFHWDGDIYSEQYAVALAQVMNVFPDVQFWLYTRSFDWGVRHLADLENCSLYLSVDKHNLESARSYAQDPRVHFAFSGKDWKETEELALDLTGHTAPKCPELTKQIPMVNKDGVGACVACGLCIYGRNNVRFAVKR